MDLAHLKTFVQLAQFKSFSKTGLKLHITQPAVSIRLKALEDELGKKLIERKGKEIQLTPAGQYFYENIINIVNNIDETVKTVQEFSSPSQFTIGVTPLCAKYVLPKILPQLYTNSDFIPMNIRTVPQSHQLMELYAKGIVDAIILSGYNLPKNLEFEELWEEPVVLVSNPHHPLTQLGDVTLDDIKSFPLALLSSDRDTKHYYNYQFIKLCEEQQVNLNIKFIMDNLELAKELVKQEPLLSLLPYLCVTDELNKNELFKIPYQTPIVLSCSIYLFFGSKNKFFSEFYYLLKEVAMLRKKELRNEQL